MARKDQNTTNVNIPEEKDNILEDEYYDRNYMEEGDEPGGDEEVKKLSSKIQLSKNGMLIALGVVAVLIAVVLFTGKIPMPKISLGGGSDANSGVASGLLDSYDEAAQGAEGEEASEEDITAMLIVSDLQEYYPNYEITRDAELKQIVAVGTMEDGQSHKMVMDYTGEMIDEVIGDTAVVTNEDGTVTEKPATGEPAQAEPKADVVEVPIGIYNKSSISKKVQTFKEDTPESEDEYYDSSLAVTTTEERLIVEYERLPIRGTTPMVYSKVIETGEEIIFSVTLRQYSNLSDKGTTVISVTRSEGYNVKTIDNVNLIKWQDSY